MEIERFNEFIVNTEKWRNNGYKNIQRWKESLCDYFRWRDITRFETWENIFPSFAVLNSYFDFEEKGLMCSNGRKEIVVCQIPDLT
jgi:hypothetical protein